MQTNVFRGGDFERNVLIQLRRLQVSTSEKKRGERREEQGEPLVRDQRIFEHRFLPSFLAYNSEMKQRKASTKNEEGEREERGQVVEKDEKCTSRTPFRVSM